MDEDLQASVEPDSYCCLLDEGQRCQNLATTATWSKRANKNIGSKLKLFTDPEVSVIQKSLLSRLKVMSNHRHSILEVPL